MHYAHCIYYISMVAIVHLGISATDDLADEKAC
jgi:hypothetical protein